MRLSAGLIRASVRLTVSEAQSVVSWLHRFSACWKEGKYGGRHRRTYYSPAAHQEERGTPALWALSVVHCLLDSASHLQGDFCLQAHAECALLISVYLDPTKEEIKSGHPKPALAILTFENT